MPVATIQTPDGRTMTLEVPEGATQEQILSFAEQNYQPEQPQEAPPEQSYYDQLRGAISTGAGNVKDTVGDILGNPIAGAKTAAGIGGQYLASEVDSGKLAMLQEFAAAGNRSVTELVDFIGPDSVNAALRLSGKEGNFPTLTDTLSRATQGGQMEPGVPRDVVQGLGGTLSAVGGMVNVPRNLAKFGPAAAEFLGAGTASPSSAAVQTNMALKRATGDASLAKVMLNEAGETVKDKAALSTIKQGFSEGLVAMTKAASQNTRSKMAAMLNIKQKGIENLRYAADNRPLDVAGDSILNRVQVVREANRNAGTRLNSVAKSLKGESVDSSPAVTGFLQELDEMGIVFNPNKGTLSFDGSDIEGLEAPQAIIKNVVKRMFNTKSPDAYDVHRLKRFLDQQVSFGASESGLKGQAKNMLKNLRHNLDGILDENFTEYNKVNTQYAETIGALNDLQVVAGTKFNLEGKNADKAMGTLSRRLLSNAQSRTILDDAISEIDVMAKKYLGGGDMERGLVPFKGIDQRAGVTLKQLDEDDIKALVQFDDQLNRVLGASAQTSLMGDIGKTTDRGVRVAAGGVKAAVVEGAAAVADKALGINEKNAIKAMRELLEGTPAKPGDVWDQ